MSTLPPNGVVRFAGEPSIFYMAICRDCGMAMPFDCAAARDQWMMQHGQTGHAIEKSVDVRWDAGIHIAGCDPILAEGWDCLQRKGSQ